MRRTYFVISRWVYWNATSAITSFFYLGKNIKLYHSLLFFLLDLDSVLVANSESVKKYKNFMTNGWMKLYYIAEALLCVCLVEVELNPEKMNHDTMTVLCVLSSRMVVWHCTVSTLVCLHPALRPLYFICHHYNHTNKHAYFSLQSQIYGISKRPKCHVCHNYNNRSTEVQNNTNIITAAVTFINIYISMKAVMILLFR